MVLTFLGALAVGLSLGLLGSGGSILTVPILVYLAGEGAKIAIAASLAIVGAISLVGAANYARQELVAWRYVLYFGLPGVVSTYAGAWVSHFVSGAVQLVVFALVMGAASITMLRGSRSGVDSGADQERHYAWLIAAGVGIGLVTGFVGVGGGFLIVPALVLLGGLRMHRAVGTSLAVITINSASGFYKHSDLIRAAGGHMPWVLIGIFSGIGIAGSLVGNVLARRLRQHHLRRLFGIFLVAMCGYILWRSVPQLI